MQSCLFIFAVTLVGGNRPPQNTAKTNVKEHTANVFFYGFYGFKCYIRSLIHSEFILYTM